MAFGAVLELAIEKKKQGILEALVSNDFIEIWTSNNLYYIKEALQIFDS
jgi:hypothetical protein